MSGTLGPTSAIAHATPVARARSHPNLSSPGWLSPCLPVCPALAHLGGPYRATEYCAGAVLSRCMSPCARAPCLASRVRGSCDRPQCASCRLAYSTVFPFSIDMAPKAACPTVTRLAPTSLGIKTSSKQVRWLIENPRTIISDIQSRNML